MIPKHMPVYCTLVVLMLLCGTHTNTELTRDINKIISIPTMHVKRYIKERDKRKQIAIINTSRSS